MLTNKQRIELIEQRITNALAPTHLEVHDESHLHAGHPGAKTGRGHFYVEIASPHFKEQKLIACHQMIYAAVGELMDTDIHALRIKIIHKYNMA